MMDDIRKLLAILRDLKSDDGENPEYDRALVDVTAAVLEIDGETAAYILGVEA